MELEPAWILATCAGIGAAATLISHIRNDASRHESTKVKEAKRREQYRRFRKEVRAFMRETREKLHK